MNVTAPVGQSVDTPADVVVVRADGEIDAANSAAFRERIERAHHRRRRLIIDLSGVEFLGIQGGLILTQVQRDCAAAQCASCVVVSPAVTRTLRVCDPDGAVCTAGSMNAALRVVRRDSVTGLSPTG